MRIGPVVSSSVCLPGTILPFCRTSSVPWSRRLNTCWRIAGISSRHDTAPVSVNSLADNALAASEGQQVLGKALFARRLCRCGMTGSRLYVSAITQGLHQVLRLCLSSTGVFMDMLELGLFHKLLHRVRSECHSMSVKARLEHQLNAGNLV